MSAGGYAARAHRSVVRKSGQARASAVCPRRLASKELKLARFRFFSPVAQQWRRTYATWNVLRGGLVNVHSANEPARGPRRLSSCRLGSEPRDGSSVSRRIPRFRSPPISEKTAPATRKAASAARRSVLCAAVLLALSSGVASANSNCRCVPDAVLPGGNLAKLRDVATDGKASRVAVSVTVRLRAVDVTPGSCTHGLSSDPVLVAVYLVDDDGDVIIDRTKMGFVCTAGKKTHAKFTTYFEGPKNCKDSAVPVGQSKGSLTGMAVTDDGALNISRKITCAAALPVSFSFTPPPHYHVTAGDTLNFSVTATRRGTPVSVIASGGPASASFDGANFSWVGGFVDTSDIGNYDVTFTADGESTVVNIATTEYPILRMELGGLDGLPAVSLPVPVGGQAVVATQPKFDNPFGVEILGGQGANAWNTFAWSIDALYLADFLTTTNLAVVVGMGGGATQLHASFTDAVLGEVTATTTLEVLEVTSVAVSPADLSLPEGSSEPLLATATLEGGTQTTKIPFLWQTSDGMVATVVEGSVLGTANVTAQGLGTAMITASTTSGPVVAGTMQATAVSPWRVQELFGMDRQSAGDRVVFFDTAGGAQFHAALRAPYDDQFCSSSSHDTNEILVGSFDLSTGFSEIQRIDPVGGVTAVFTSTIITQIGDTIDVEAIRYRPDGEAYIAMSEGQHTLTRVNGLGELIKIGGPKGNDGFGPIGIAPFGNALVYSGPWGAELLGQGNKVEGFAEFVARYVPGEPVFNEFIARIGVSLPRLVAPGGDLWILDGGSGELFRFEDLNGDGDYYEIETTSVMGETLQTAVDDPGERILAGQLPIGFNRLRLDFVTGDIIATRVVGSVPQRITVMRVADLNSDGDVDDPGEQEIVFDAGAPAGTDTADVLLKY